MHRSVRLLATSVLVLTFQSGAYGLTASPLGFLSHPTPAEVLVSEGSTRLILDRLRWEDLAR